MRGKREGRADQAGPAHNGLLQLVTPRLDSMAAPRLDPPNVERVRCFVDPSQSLIEIQVKTLTAVAKSRVSFGGRNWAFEVVLWRRRAMLVTLILNSGVREPKIAPAIALSLGLIRALAVLLVPWCLSSYCQVSPEEQHARVREQTQALGSLSTAGEVYVNDSRAVPESTIFIGDRLRTGPTGVATLASSGRGTLKVFPQSEVTFSGNDQFTAELEAGTVVLSSIAGGSGMILRVGEFVLVPSFPREQSISSKVERTAEGSFTVSCFDGSVGVLGLEDRSGEFLHGGQSLRVSLNKLATGGLAPVFSSRAMPKSPLQRISPERFTLGVGGAGGVALLIDRLIQSRSSPSVSPSTP